MPAGTTPPDLAPLEASIGHRFATRQLLLDALTHRSYAYEYAAPDVVSNERLEFLGDAVLGLIASDLLYARFPQAPEGELTTLRAALVRASALATLARAVELGPYLRLGRGEETTGGRERELLLARAMEALIGAVYRDAGLETTRQMLDPLLDGELARVLAQRQMKDDKSLLQERAQAHLGVTPVYRVAAEEGPSHNRSFTVEVLLGERVIGSGLGRSKRQAEQAAAHDALRDEGWMVVSLPSVKPEEAS
ncbi:MAG: ribonuclease III [Ktedonobacterales bacterium]